MSMYSNNTTPDIGNSVSIVGGKFTLRVPEGTPNSVPRKLTKGKNEGSIVHELHWSTLENVHIMSGALVKSEHLSGLNAEIVVKNFLTGEEALLSLPSDSRYLKEFIKRIPSIDFNQAVNLELHLGKKKTRTGGDTYYLKIVQNGKAVPSVYEKWSRDENGKPKVELLLGMPDAVEKRDGWDFSAQNEFLWDKFELHFKQYIPPTVDVSEAHAPAEDDEEPYYDEREDDEPLEDDVPF